MNDAQHPGVETLETHLRDSLRAARDAELPDDDLLWVVSLGQDANEGGGQFLSVHGEHVAITPVSGDGAPLEVPFAHIRSVEADPGHGLVIHLEAGCTVRHMVSDHVAQHLRHQIISLRPFPPRGAGGRAVPDQPWRRSRLANLVGLIVMEAAEAEHQLGWVAELAGRITDAASPRAFGESGTSLAKLLETAGRSSTVITDLAASYRPLIDSRNQLIHSIRPGDSFPGQTHRPLRRKGKDPDPNDLAYDVRDEQLPALVDLWWPFHDLKHDASRVSWALTAGTPPEALAWEHIGHRTSRET